MLINDDQRAVYKTVCLVIFVEIIYIHTHTHTHTQKKDGKLYSKMLTVTEFGMGFVSFFTFSIFSQRFHNLSS